jgi:septum site-determining protein MinD
VSKISNVIGIISSKGGVGKTTLTANLGLAMADFGYNPILVDANVKAGSLGLHLGMYENEVMDSQESYGEDDLSWKGIYIHPEYDIKFVPSPLYATNVDFELGKLIGNLKDTRNPVIIDFAPAHSDEAMKTIQVIDKAVVISTPKIPSLTDAMRTIKTLRERDKDILGIVLNKKGESKQELSRKEVEEACDERVISEIPYDENVLKEDDGVPVLDKKPRSPASKEIKRLAADLLGVDWYSPGLIARIKKFFGKNEDRRLMRKPLDLDPDSKETTESTRNNERIKEKFKCEICGETFESERALHIHQTKGHKKEVEDVKKKLEDAKEKLTGEG